MKVAIKGVSKEACQKFWAKYQIVDSQVRTVWNYVKALWKILQIIYS